MENFGQQKERFFSEEQNKKLGELMEIIQPLHFSLDSNEAFELSEGIERLKRSLEAQNFEPGKYLLWTLLTEGDLDNPEANQEFDTPDEQIENFIRIYKKPERLQEAA
ncbi:MAG: hypothetical protein PHN69_00535 [Candidatus Pacebacteria bacterium]|nr:hypothetical protein [Candidatus Paceibacterota bacterium]